jgi:hypothetical protein
MDTTSGPDEPANPIILGVDIGDPNAEPVLARRNDDGTIEVLAPATEPWPQSIADTCCGNCPGATCYVDFLTGERS